MPRLLMSALNSDLVQAIRGPIMLMTLGALVAIDYFEGVSFTTRTWPVLLIVFGVLKLLEKSAPQGMYSGPVPPAQGGRPQ